MGSVRRWWLAAGALSLTGCVLPVRSSGSDEAIRLYREQARRGVARTTPGADVSGEGALAPVPEALTADAAVALAKARSAKLAALAARAAAAAALVDVAGRLPNPEVQVQNLRLDQVLSGKPRERTSIRMPIPRPGEIDARVAAAKADEAEARAAFHAEEMALEGDVRWLFDDVLLLEAQIEAAGAVVAAREAVAAQMKARLDAAQATALDEAMAAITAVEAVEDRTELAGRRAAVRAALFVQLGLPADAEVRVTGERPDAWPPPPLPDERTLVEAALRVRPEIEVAAARVDATGARAFAERAKRWPWLTFVELGYEVGPGIPEGQGFTLQAGIELPILDTNRKGVVAADASQRVARLDLTAAVQRVSREVGVRLQAARVAEGQVTDLKKIVLPASRRASAAIRQALQAHDVDVVLALMVDVRRVRVEMLYLDAIRRYRAAVADLRRSLGGALPSGQAPSAPEGAPK